MKSYFSQFGHVKRLRVSRNKKTGASKHYAFVEFASSDVADIVAKTMDKYLMFNHILQCKVIPPEQVHADMFKGAGHRFKAIPLNKMAGAQMARGAERAIWEKRVEKENKRRQKKAKQSEAAFGYEYEAPTLKATEGVPKKALALRNGSEQPLQIEASGHDTVAGAIEPKGAEKLEHAVPEPAQSALDKKSKKGKKAKTDVAPEKGEDTVDAVEPALEKKTKKGKKSKANAVLDNVEDVLEAAADVLIESAELASDKKTKRGKKTKANTVPGNVEEGVEAPADGVLEPAEPILNTKTKKGKKAKASVLPENVEEAVAAVVDGVSELAEAVLDKKTKKGKKSKANAASEHLEEAVEPATKDAPKKQESKDAKVSSVVETSTPEKKRKAAPAEEGAAIPKKAKKVKKVKA
jgi:nucleolar protein 15